MKRNTHLGVLVIDPEPIARFGLVQLISSHGGLAVVGEAESVCAGRDLCMKVKPSVVVLDPAMESGEGFGLIREVPRWAPQAKVVAFSGQVDASCIQRAFSAGACGYVTRRDPVESVMQVILGAAAGEHQMSPRVAKALASAMATGAVGCQTGLDSRLSEREWQIFQMLGEGAPVRNIADALHVSVKTVESHQQRIKVKLDVHSATELRKRAADFVADRGRGAQ